MQHCKQMRWILNSCLANEMKKMGVQFTHPDKLQSEHTMNNAALVHPHDQQTFLRLLHLSYFQEMAKVF